MNLQTWGLLYAIVFLILCLVLLWLLGYQVHISPRG